MFVVRSWLDVIKLCKCALVIPMRLMECCLPGQTGGVFRENVKCRQDRPASRPVNPVSAEIENCKGWSKSRVRGQIIPTRKREHRVLPRPSGRNRVNCDGNISRRPVQGAYMPSTWQTRSSRKPVRVRMLPMCNNMRSPCTGYMARAETNKKKTNYNK